MGHRANQSATRDGLLRRVDAMVYRISWGIRGRRVRQFSDPWRYRAERSGETIPPIPRTKINVVAIWKLNHGAVRIESRCQIGLTSREIREEEEERGERESHETRCDGRRRRKII